MDELLIRLADILDMSVDKVIETYPILRNQYINSYLYANVSNITMCLLIGGGIITIAIASITVIDMANYGEIDTDYLIALIITLIVTVLLLLLTVYLKNMVIQTAPDLMFIYSIL